MFINTFTILIEKAGILKFETKNQAQNRDPWHVANQRKLVPESICFTVVLDGKSDFLPKLIPGPPDPGLRRASVSFSLRLFSLGKNKFISPSPFPLLYILLFHSHSLLFPLICLQLDFHVTSISISISFLLQAFQKSSLLFKMAGQDYRNILIEKI